MGFKTLSLVVNLAGTSLPGLGREFQASPALTGTDGFYCAALGVN